MNIMDKLDLNAFTEFSNSVAKKYNISEEEADDFVLKLGPKKLKRLGIFEASQGWREDLTKSSVEKRKIILIIMKSLLDTKQLRNQLYFFSSWEELY